MATFRQWSVIRDAIRKSLRERSVDDTFFANDLLLEVWNEKLQLRGMDLIDSDEGWLRGVRTYEVTAVDDFRFPLPVDISVVQTISVYNPTNKEIQPVMRRERLRKGSRLDAISGESNLPTARLIGNEIYFTPAFGDATLEIWIEADFPPEPFSQDTDTLSSSLPLQTEHMLILDTLLGLAETEAAQGADARNRIRQRFGGRHRAFETRWIGLIERRWDGINHSIRNDLGA